MARGRTGGTDEIGKGYGSICENEICEFDLRPGVVAGSITDRAMKK